MRIAFLIAVVAALILPAAAAAQNAYRINVFDTHSSVRIVRLAFGWRRLPRARSEPVSFSCLSFVDTGARAVKQIKFHFADYDVSNDLIGESDVIRSGMFSPGVTIEGINQKEQSFNAEDCALNASPHMHLGLIFTFVKEVTFADGSVWSTSGPEIPKHLGDPNPAASP